MSTNKPHKPLFNGCLIALGALMLLSTLFIPSGLIIFQILGIVFLMVGAYRSSLFRSEVLENKKDHEK